jgi:hypothetical protein
MVSIGLFAFDGQALRAKYAKILGTKPWEHRLSGETICLCL